MYKFKTIDSYVATDGKLFGCKKDLIMHEIKKVWISNLPGREALSGTHVMAVDIAEFLHDYISEIKPLVDALDDEVGKPTVEFKP